MSGREVPNPEELLKAYISAFDNSRTSPNEEGMWWARTLLICAELDLVACRLLHEHGLFALSVYHLQQASEKADKSFLMWRGILREEDLKAVGHNSFRVSDVVLEKAGPSKDLLDLIHPLPDPSEAGRLSMRETHPKPEDIARASYDSIIEYTAFDKGNQELRMRLGALVEAIRGEGAEGVLTIDEYIDEMEALAAISSISVVTFPHAITTRYPSIDSKDLNPVDYTQELGIVRALPELMRKLGRAIRTISKIYKSQEMSWEKKGV